MIESVHAAALHGLTFRDIVGVVPHIRATCLLQFHELVTELGADPAELLREAGLRPEDAGQPDRFISLDGAVQAVENAAHATSTPDFGRRLAARRGIETIGPLGEAAQTSPTLNAAFATLSTFIGAHSPGLHVGLAPGAQLDTAFFEFRIIGDSARPQRQAMEIGLGAALQILRAILGSSYSPLAVHLPHSALTPAADYVRYFGCTARFAQPAAGFELRAADLRRPLRRDDQAHGSAVNQLSALTGDRSPSLSQAVISVARPLLPAGVLTVDLVARQLGLHPRTLQRRLAAEHTTFAALVDDIRRQAAHRYLRDTDISLAHITRLLGYAEHSVFTRSCQRWFAVSPTAYRAGVDARHGPPVASRPIRPDC